MFSPPALPQNGIDHVVGLKDMLSEKEYFFTKGKFIPFQCEIECNYSHDAAYINVLHGKMPLVKLAKGMQDKPKGEKGKATQVKSLKNRMVEAHQGVPPMRCSACA